MKCLEAALAGFSLFATVLGAGPALAQPSNGAEAAQDVIPFTFERDRVYLPVSGAHGPLGLFVLDTGAELCVIDSAVAAPAGARLLGETTLRGAGRGELSARDTAPLSLRIGQTGLDLDSAEVGPINALLEPLSGRRIGGVLGRPFFEAHVVTVDFARRTVTLNDPKTFTYLGPGTRLPFQLAGSAPIVDGEITLTGGARLKLRVLVDLGAEADLLIAEPFARKHAELAALKPQVILPLGAGVGGETRFAFARLPRLDLGSLTTNDLIAGLSVNGALPGGYYDALAGAGVLKRYRVTFDYHRREIILEPNPDAEPDRFDRSGAFLVQALDDPHHLTLHFIAPASPAAEAGLRVGDVVRAIAGKPASALRLNEARALLADDGNPAVPVSVERNGTAIETTLRLRSLVEDR